MNFDFVQIFLVLIPMLLSLTVHEYAHARVAAWLHDNTAANLGRLTLNPIAHIDPIGTLALPVLGMITGFPFFGWAKPVPVNPLQFTRRIRMKTGMFLVSAAGPVSNLLLAVIFALILGIVGPDFLPDIRAGVMSTGAAAVRFMGYTMMTNIMLCLFNLLPVPPLDGSKVLAGILPDRLHYVIEFLERYSFVMFILLIAFAGRLIAPLAVWMLVGLSHLVGFNLFRVISF